MKLKISFFLLCFGVESNGRDNGKKYWKTVAHLQLEHMKYLRKSVYIKRNTHLLK